MSEEMTWLGTTSASCSNHHSERPVSTAPLSGIAVGRITSKADIRSLATSSSWSSPTAYRSLTLPECRSGSGSVVTGSVCQADHDQYLDDGHGDRGSDPRRLAHERRCENRRDEDDHPRQEEQQ